MWRPPFGLNVIVGCGFTGEEVVRTNRIRETISATIVCIIIIASCAPMHCLGPPPNGK
jgi:hypothetical protein